MSCSTAIMNSGNHDDLLAAATKFKNLPCKCSKSASVLEILKPAAFAFDLVSEVSRTLKFNVDYSEESHHDTLIRNPSIQLSLSMQNALGYNGDSHNRTFGSKIAWTSLQLRNCVVLMTMAVNIKVPIPDQQRKVSGLEDPGRPVPSTITILIGC
jgi:mediator of RNA polymerase II transcription subunit 16